MNRTQPLALREEPQIDLIDRLMALRAATLDEANRSVEVVLATDTPTRVYAPDLGEAITDILLPDAGQYPDQLPLLENHMRTSLEDVIGSVRQIRQEGNTWVGRMYFATGSPRAEMAWNLVKQGHVKGVSIGYRWLDAVDIMPGQRAVVAGKEYVAPLDSILRVSRRYEPRECSLVPIGADKKAGVRKDQTTGRPPRERMGSMNPLLRRYLESLGLRADASEKDAQAYWKDLKGAQRALADGIEAGTVGQAEVEQLCQRGEAGAGQATRQAADAGAGTANSTAAANATATLDPEVMRREVLQAERSRIASIREAADGIDIPGELVQRAIDEGWDRARFDAQALRHIRDSRSPAVGADNGRAPAGIVRERNATVRVLGFAMAMRSALQDETRMKRWAQRNHVQDWSRLAEQADRYRDLAMIDVCREALALDRVEIPASREELVQRAAVSGGALSQIFTDSVNATLMAAYEEENDSTRWCSEGEVGDFKTQTNISYAANASLKKLARGKTAEHADVEDSAETYKIARFARQFVVDDQDIIDDNFGALTDAPNEFGRAARRLRPDLVYGILLDNPTMADTGEVFNSTALTTAGGHANYAASADSTAAGGPMASGSLEAAITAMRKQYRVSGKSKVPLNIVPQFLVVPPDLEFTASVLLRSAERIISASSGGTFNPLQGRLDLIVEQRIGALGFTDPDTGETRTGTAVNYFLFSRPGLHCKVAYRRGTGRVPQVRSFVLDKGQWGLGWDVKMDIGAKFIDFRGAYKAKGAA